jgi:hypothetical protein
MQVEGVAVIEKLYVPNSCDNSSASDERFNRSIYVLIKAPV